MSNKQVSELEKSKTMKNGRNGDEILVEIKNRKKQTSKENLDNTQIKEAVTDKNAIDLLLEQNDEGLIKL